MTAQLRIILIFMIIITGMLVIRQIKRKNLALKYTISWLFLLFVILIVSIFPGILGWLSGLMGIELPINMVFFLGFIFTLIIMYRLTEAVSKMSSEITELTQKVALLDKEIKEQNKK
jgi:Uncharacterized conserved protein